MSRLKTGEYRVRFYDRYGGIIRGLDEDVKSLGQGRDCGELVVNDKENKATSFTVDRRIFNSLDETNRF